MHYNLIDANESEHRQHAQRLRTVRSLVVLWLLVVALSIALVPLMLAAGWVRSDRVRLEADLDSMQLILSDVTLPTTELLQLREEMTQTEALIAAIQAVAVPVSVDWPQVVNALNEYNRVGLMLTSIQQQGRQVRITGSAPTNDAVVRYQQSLMDSGAFREVIIASLTLVLPSVPAATGETGGSAPPVVVSSSVEFVIDVVAADLVMEVSAP
jgi:Tfp pilus assembly protein PilN